MLFAKSFPKNVFLLPPLPYPQIQGTNIRATLWIEPLGTGDKVGVFHDSLRVV